MAILTWQQARNLLVVDPDTGRQIPHVKATDPEKGLIEVYTTVPCAPYHGMEMQRITRNADGTETTERFHYTFVQMRDPVTGVRYFCSRWHQCRYELVDKNTGEVVVEVDGPRAFDRFLDPAQVAREYGFETLGRGSAVLDVKAEVPCGPNDR